MSIAERKQREKEEMRQLILSAARAIFLEKGYTQTSIRNIADKIDYSPGTIYLYFREKDEIFHALHEEGFARLLEKMQPLQHVSDPFERLKAIGLVYLEFARNNPDLYDLMFIIDAPIKHEDEHEQWQMGHQTLEYLKSVLKQCQQKGYFKGLDTEYLSFMIWSTVHGMAALLIRERCKAYHDLEPGDLLKKGYEYFVKMIEKL